MCNFSEPPFFLARTCLSGLQWLSNCGEWGIEMLRQLTTVLPLATLKKGDTSESCTLR